MKSIRIVLLALTVGLLAACSSAPAPTSPSAPAPTSPSAPAANSPSAPAANSPSTTAPTSSSAQVLASPSTQAPTSPSTQASNTGGPVDVQVTLSEMKIESSLTTFSMGVPYHFIVTNAGTVPHEIMIMPVMMSGGMMNGGMMSNMSMEQLDEMALAHIESDDLPPGATKTLDYTFTTPAPAGTLEFACYLPGHHEAGMHEAITVQ